MKVLKTAFEDLTTANSENAEKTMKMCTACTTVIEDHPDVPTFLGSDDVAEGMLCLSPGVSWRGAQGAPFLKL